MSISPLLSIAGTALVPLARSVVEQLGEGLSFQRLLQGDVSHDAALDEPAGQRPALSLPATPEAAQLEAIFRQPVKELEAYVDRLRERLTAAGIDLSVPIPLKVGIGGDIQIDGSHPDRAAIEDLLNGDMQLASTFRLLANALTTQHAAAPERLLAGEFQLTIDAANFTPAFQ